METGDIVGIFLCGVAVAIVLIMITLPNPKKFKDVWQAEAIEKGHAEYNQQTGDWQWKEVKDVAVQK